MIQVNVVEIPYKETDIDKAIVILNNNAAHTWAKAYRSELPRHDCECGGVTVLTVKARMNVPATKEISYCCDKFKKSKNI